MEPVIVVSDEAELTVSETPTGSAFATEFNVKPKISAVISSMALLRMPQIYRLYRKSLAVSSSTFTLKINSRRSAWIFGLTV
jgi:hypothetical protein